MPRPVSGADKIGCDISGIGGAMIGASSTGSGESSSFFIAVGWTTSDEPGPCKLFVALSWYVFKTVRKCGVTNSVIVFIAYRMRKLLKNKIIKKKKRI